MNKREIIAALENEEFALQEKIRSLRETIKTLKQSMVLDDVDEPAAKQNGRNGSASNGDIRHRYAAFFKARSWREKVTIILKNENRFLHYREIIDIILQLDSKATKDNLKNSISPALSFLKNEGVIVKVKHGDSNVNTFWGSRNWLNQDGSVKPGFEYDESQVTAGSNGNTYEI